MKCVNVIVADADHDALMRNTKQLSDMGGIDIVASTMYGAEVIEKVFSSDVDVVVTDIVLRGIDGIGVLEAFRKMKRPAPKPLILTRMSTETVQEAAFARGASFFMAKPAAPGQLYERIKMLAGCERGRDEEVGPNEACIIGKLLREAGVSPDMKGYMYLEEAVRLRMENDERYRRLIEMLYPAIALRFSTTAQSVERSIRTAILSAWKSGGIQRFYQEKKDGVILEKKPTAGQMIEFLLMCVKENSLVIN